MVGSAAGFVLGAIALLTPQSLGRVFLNYWFQLASVLGGLLWVVGSYAERPQLTAAGKVVVFVVLAAAATSWILGAFLREWKPKWAIRVLQFILAVVVALLLCVIIRHAGEDWQIMRTVLENKLDLLTRRRGL